MFSSVSGRDALVASLSRQRRQRGKRIFLAYHVDAIVVVVEAGYGSVGGTVTPWTPRGGSGVDSAAAGVVRRSGRQETVSRRSRSAASGGGGASFALWLRRSDDRLTTFIESEIESEREKSNEKELSIQGIRYIRYWKLF